MSKAARLLCPIGPISSVRRSCPIFPKCPKWPKWPKWLAGWVLLLRLACPIGAAASDDSVAADDSFGQRLAEVILIVEEQFWTDPLELPAYPTAKQQALEQVAQCRDAQDFATLVNRLLSSLETSHTYYLTPADWEYYHLAAIFEKVPAVHDLFGGQAVQMPSLGLIVRHLEDQWVVANVFPRGPADRAGVAIGDVLLTIGDHPYSPVEALRPWVDRPAQLTVRRADRLENMEVVPQLVQPGQELLEAMEASLEVVEVQGRRIGYVHIYSYAGRAYHEVLEQAVAWGPLREAEALVIDLRFGLGGASAGYLSLFLPTVPVLTMIDRQGQRQIVDSQWRKPLVMLVDHSTRSGKEVLAYGAKKHGLATIVGTRTAGAVVGGSPFVIGNEDLLYLAVRDVLVDGQRLEGQGVEPDVEVRWDLLNSDGQDTQRQAALEKAAAMLDGR